ncbi:MAG: CHAP domain-containing protein, partial [Gammaproteobacteria bacterium]
MSIDHDHHAPFGTLLGTAPGEVAVFSSHYPSADKHVFSDRRSYRSYVDGLFMGYKWQCVELARRWLYVNKGYVFEDVAMAYDLFEIRSYRRIHDGVLLPVHAFDNGSARQPEPGCLLIWDEGGDFHTTGHVAVVTEVLLDRIRFVEQNVEDHIWPEDQPWSRELPVSIDGNGGYHIACSDKECILGWLLQTDDATDARPRRHIDQQLLNLLPMQSAALPDASWLDASDPIDNAYLASMGGPWLTADSNDQQRYFCMTETAERELKRASNELHAMFLYATDVVMQDERLLEKFNIPRAVWPKLQMSWNNRRNQMITGRFDFSMSERGLKVYEYNADSASCYLECGELQGRWAEAVGIDDGWDPGEDLHQHLIDAWRRAGVGHTLHILQDDDPEETYHALYMQSAATKAGIPCKIITGLSSLSWDAEGYVVDADGLRVQWIWKTWAWETALDQLRAECSEDETRALLHAPASPPSGQPRLVDVLLRKDVLVFEPFWTLIPSNKAILPILWQLFPDHPYLLEAAFELNESLTTQA